MQDVIVIGIDLGKRSFHLHGQDKSGKAVFRKKVSRQQLIEFLRGQFKKNLDGLLTFAARC